MPIQRLKELISKGAVISNLSFLKEPKQFAISVGLASAVLLLAYANFIVIPQIARVAGVVAKSNKVSAKLAGAKKSIKNIPQYKTDIGIYKKKVDKYEYTLPAEQEIPSLLQNLADIARDSGVRIESITPVVKKEEKPSRERVYHDMPILITAVSGYHELGRFVSSLENSQRFMKVMDIEIKAEKANPRKHSVKLLVVTYVLSDVK